MFYNTCSVIKNKMLIFRKKAYSGPRPLPLAYSLYAFINVDNCERPLKHHPIEHYLFNTHTTPGMSDHEAVTFDVNLNPIRNRKPPHKVFKCKSADWCKLKNEISKMTDKYFDTDPNSHDVNTNWIFFRDNLTTLMNNTIPYCNTKAKSHLPWISRELIRMQRRRNKSHKKAKQTGLNKHWEQFRELRRQTTKALATSYKSYVNNQIGDSLKTNPKRFWSFIKANKRENIGIPTLRVNEKPITNDRDKANALNNQFTSVFTSESYPIPVIDHSLYSSIPPLDIGTNGIIKQLKNLNQNKATGPDELPARVLRETAEQIAPIITHIFQQSYNTGKLPASSTSHPLSTRKALNQTLGFYAWTLTTTVVSDYTQTPRLLANNAMYVRRQLKVTDNSRD